MLLINLSSPLTSNYARASLDKYHLSPQPNQQPLPHILNILPHKLPNPQQRTIMPPLRMDGEHCLLREASFFDCFDHLTSCSEFWETGVRC